MYAIVKEKRAPGAEITTVNIPKVERNEVLVKVKTASICGTDVHIWNWNKWAQERITKVPFIFGHELCGEVVDVGVDMSNVKVGDFVSAETHIVDGTCYQCQTDRMHVCRHVQILGVDRDGAFADTALAGTDGDGIADGHINQATRAAVVGNVRVHLDIDAFHASHG